MTTDGDGVDFSWFFFYLFIANIKTKKKKLTVRQSSRFSLKSSYHCNTKIYPRFLYSKIIPTDSNRKHLSQIFVDDFWREIIIEENWRPIKLKIKSVDEQRLKKSQIQRVVVKYHITVHMPHWDSIESIISMANDFCNESIGYINWNWKSAPSFYCCSSFMQY